MYFASHPHLNVDHVLDALFYSSVHNDGRSIATLSLFSPQLAVYPQYCYPKGLGFIVYCVIRHPA